MSKCDATVGKAAYELLRKAPEKINVIDMQREMQKSTAKELDDIISRHRHYEKRYYIYLMYQRDRIIPNLIRQKFIVRRTRPEPIYDTSLFSYDNESSELKYHWTIPDEETCQYLLANESSLSSEERELCVFVKQFADGTLV